MGIKNINTPTSQLFPVSLSILSIRLFLKASLTVMILSGFQT